MKIIWKLNDGAEEEIKTYARKFINPGNNKIKAVLITEDGYFKVVAKEISVPVGTISQYQMLSIENYNLTNVPDSISASLEGNEIIFYKSVSEKVYVADMGGITGANLSLNIPVLNYASEVTIVENMNIENFDQYMNEEFDKISSSFNIYSTNLEIRELGESLKKVVLQLRNEYNAMSEDDRKFYAEKYKSNIIASQNQTASIKSNTLFPSLFPEAFAAVLTGNDVDVRITNQMRTYTTSDIIGTGAAVTIVGSGLLILKFGISYDRGIGLALVAYGMGLIYKEYQRRSAIIVDIYDFARNFALDEALTDEVYTLNFRGNFIPMQKNNARGRLVKNTVTSTENFNSDMRDLNKKIGVINGYLKDITESMPTIGTLPLLSYSGDSFNGKLATQFIKSINVINSEDGSVKIDGDLVRNEGSIKVKFKAKKSQMAKIRVTYKNDELDVHIYKDFDLMIIVKEPKAVINESNHKLDVTFNSFSAENQNFEGIKYIWDFGDGTEPVVTTNTVTTHSYEKIGKYNVKLKVMDKDEVYSEIEKEIAVTYSITINIDPTGSYTFVDTVIGWLDEESGKNTPDVKYPATEFDLAEFYNDPRVNLKAGDKIKLELSGYFDPGIADWQQDGDSGGASGVFKGSGGFMRPGSGSTASSMYTTPTCNQNMPTDIPEDFSLINGGSVEVVVPAGATSILFEPGDCFYSENIDTNGDFKVKITVEPRDE